MTRKHIANTIVIVYDIIILPFRIIRLFLDWWNDNVGYALTSYLADWVTNKEDHGIYYKEVKEVE